MVLNVIVHLPNRATCRRIELDTATAKSKVRDIILHGNVLRILVPQGASTKT